VTESRGILTGLKRLYDGGAVTERDVIQTFQTHFAGLYPN
jgi:hypothetical protein